MTAAAAAPGDLTAEPTDLHAPTLRLRLLDERDRDLYHALHSSPEVMRAIGTVPDAATIEANFGRVVRHNRSRRPGHRAWAIHARSNGEGLGLAVLLRTGTRAEFGIMLLPTAWRRGVATAAIARLLPHAFEAMDIEHIDVSRPDDAFVPVLDGMFAPFRFLRTSGLRDGDAGWTLSRRQWCEGACSDRGFDR